MGNELVVIGYVIKTHGVHGHLKIAFSDTTKELSEKEALYFFIKGSQVPYFIQSITYFKNGEALVLLEEITNKEDANRFTKQELFGPESYVVEEEFVEEEWVDFAIVDEEMGLIGKVIGSTDMGEYLLLEVMHNENPVLIPLHDDLIVKVDEEQQQITMRLPDGLINL